MSDQVFKIVEIVGTSRQSIEDAIQNGISRASNSLRHLSWFKVLGTRGHVDDDGKILYQITMKVGFRMEDPD